MSKLLALNYREPNFHVITLVLLIVCGLVLATMAWKENREARNHLNQVSVEVVNLANAIGERQEIMLGQSEHLLQVLGGVSLIDAQGTGSCDALLARQLKSFPLYNNLAFADTNGLIHCSAHPWWQTSAQTFQPQLQNALNKLSISPTDPQSGYLIFSASHIDPNGNIVGSVLAQISANQFLRPAGVQIPLGLQLAIFDQNGRWIAAYPSQENWINATRQDSSFNQTLIALKAGSPARILAPDGVMRLYTARTVHGTGKGTGLTLITGITVDEATNTLTANNNLALAGLVMIALALSALIISLITSMIPRFKHMNLYHTRIYTYLNHFYRALRGDIPTLAPSARQNKTSSTLVQSTDYEALKQAFVSHEERTRYIERLDQLSQSLQSCMSHAEVAGAVALCAQDMIPDSSGALLLKSGPGKIKVLVKWGSYIYDEAMLQPTDNGTMSQNQPYWAGEATTPTDYFQLPADQSRYICIPLIAHNEAVGALHLGELNTALHSGRQNHTHWVANSIAERAAIAIRNTKRLQKLRFKATRDVLTGLYNRRFMEETFTIEERRALRGDLAIGILILDVDHFKRYNDTYGHDAGDALLRAIGGIVRTTVRKCDIPCRYGGEEFVIILPEADLEDTCQRAEMLRSAIENLNTQHNNQTLEGVTVSIGAAAFPQNGDSWQSVLKKADQALYQAKHAGRNRVMKATI